MKRIKLILTCMAVVAASSGPVSATLDQLGWSWFQYPWIYSSLKGTWTYMVPTDNGLWLNNTENGEWRFQGDNYVWSSGDLRPTLDAFVDRVIYVENDWAGESFIVKKDESGFSVVWRVHGSGVPIVSESTVSATNPSNYQIRFSVGSDNYKMGIHDAGRIKVYLNGKRIYA